MCMKARRSGRKGSMSPCLVPAHQRAPFAFCSSGTWGVLFSTSTWIGPMRPTDASGGLAKREKIRTNLPPESCTCWALRGKDVQRIPCRNLTQLGMSMACYPMSSDENPLFHPSTTGMVAKKGCFLWPPAKNEQKQNNKNQEQ